jgi:hypothetical protein
MTCPGCGGAMTAETLPGHLGASVTIDVCAGCQRFWFDERESLQLSPPGVLALFRIIGETALASRAASVLNPPCPRCKSRLVATHDQQRNVRFQYLRCPHGHGRLITFVEFLREKNFIQPLTPRQIEELRQNVSVVNCSNCGAAIDLTTRSSCEHCGSALSMLDLKQASALIAELRAADAPRSIDPALPLDLARARHQVDAAFAAFEKRSDWFGDVSKGGLLAAGLSSFARWLKSEI